MADASHQLLIMLLHIPMQAWATLQAYDPCGPHQCVIPFQIQSTQSSISALLPHQQEQLRIQQQRHSEPCQHHQKCHVLGTWGRFGGSLLWLQDYSTHPNYTWQNGAHTTYDARHDRQHYGTRFHRWHHDLNGFQLNGSTIPLVEMPQCATTVHILMAPRHPWSRQLHQLTTYTQASSSICPFFIFNMLATQ